MMTSYKITYQTRHKVSPSDKGPSDWRDKEMVVVAGDDAREAVNIVDLAISSVSGQEFRLKEIEVCGLVDAISPSVLK